MEDAQGGEVSLSRAERLELSLSSSSTALRKRALAELSEEIAASGKATILHNSHDTY